MITKDCYTTLDSRIVGGKKTKFEKVINYIKNLFRSKGKKTVSLKLYLDDENYIEKFVTVDKMEVGKETFTGPLGNEMGTVSFSGRFKK